MHCVIVTGAAGGIGRETVRMLAADDLTVLCVDVDETRLQSLLEDLSECPGSRRSLVSRLEDADACRDVVRAAPGTLTGLVHLAGLFEADPGGIDDMAVYDRAIQHNLTNGYLMAGAVAEAVPEARSGAMVFASSLAFRRGSWEHVPYAAAKGGLVGMTRALARKYAPRIRVNALAPGIIDTAMPAALVADRGIDRITAEIPLKRLGEASEVASVIAFLMSDAASYITGQCINVDGGIIQS